jgi:hypothetical protein
MFIHIFAPLQEILLLGFSWESWIAYNLVSGSQNSDYYATKVFSNLRISYDLKIA